MTRFVALVSALAAMLVPAVALAHPHIWIQQLVRVVAKDGRVFVSDSGLKSSATGFDPTGTDAVYVIEKGKVKPVAKGKDLNGPNGLLAVS